MLQGVLHRGARLLQLCANDFEARRTHARVADTDFLLDLFNELNEFRHRIHAQQRQEPAIKREGFFMPARDCSVEQGDGLSGEGVYQSGDPADSACGNAFDDGIIHQHAGDQG